MDFTAQSKVKEMSIEATVIRCRCGHPETHPDTVCPVGESRWLGIIQYWHRNPIKRIAKYFKL